jgi:catechol 2,3-dioxygenase-like lactoylglutathione lyase family enzyme
VLDDWERSAEWYRSLLTFLGLTCVSDTDRGFGGAYDHTPFLYFVGGKTAVGFHKSEGECRGTKFDQRRAGATARSSLELIARLHEHPLAWRVGCT